MMPFVCRWLVVSVAVFTVSCGSSTSPTAATAVLVLDGFTATVEPITTPEKGWLYRLSYQVRETAGTHAATLVNQHFALSNGFVADKTFNPTTKVAAHSTTSWQSTLTVLTTTVAASRVTFSVTFTDDGGSTGSASAAADIVPKT